MLRRMLAAFSSLTLAVATVLAQSQPAQKGFEPVGPGTVVEQLPAAPLVVAAYGFVWIALMVYLWSIWRRIGRIDADLKALEQRRSRQASER
jgi:CcmD family protein